MEAHVGGAFPEDSHCYLHNCIRAAPLWPNPVLRIENVSLEPVQSHGTAAGLLLLNNTVEIESSTGDFLHFIHSGGQGFSPPCLETYLFGK